MMTSTITDRQARIHLKVMGPQGQEQEVEALIDTGYSESLTLAPDLVAALGLRWLRVDRTILADGNECIFDVYDGQVIWDGKPCHVRVAELGTIPLVGMALLSGYELKMQVRPGGKATIKQLSTGPKGRKRRE